MVLVVKLSTGAEFTVGNVPAVDAVTGIISYTWTAAESSQIIGLGIPSVDHRAEWTFTVGAETIERVQFFDVPVADLVTRVHSEMLVEEVPLLENHRQKENGPVGSGSTTTQIVDTGNLQRYRSGYWDGSIVQVVGESKRVTVSDGETGTLTLASALSSTPFGTYRLERGYDYQVDSAFQLLQNKLTQSFGRGHYARLLDGEDLTQIHLHLAAAEACKSRIGDDPGFMDLYKIQSAAFSDEMALLKAKVSQRGDSDSEDLDPDLASQQRLVYSPNWGTV